LPPILLVLLAPLQLWAADPLPSHARALELFQKKDFQGAIAEYHRLIAAAPSDTRALYNAACAYSWLGEKAKAIEHLKKAIQAGWTDRQHWERDPDLDAIRQDAGYRQALTLLNERLAQIAVEDETRIAKLKALDATFQKALANAVIPPQFQKPKDGWPAKPRTGQYNEQLEIFSRVKIEAYDHPNGWFHLGVPADYTSDKAWPLARLLHGGPNGKADDLAWMARLLNRHGILCAYVQAVSPPFELNWKAPLEGMNCLVIIKQIARTWRIDPYRIYLLGHSMGGGGAVMRRAPRCAMSGRPLCPWRRSFRDAHGQRTQTDAGMAAPTPPHHPARLRRRRQKTFQARSSQRLDAAKRRHRLLPTRPLAWSIQVELELILLC
jgi:hypothetical protein